MAMNYQTRRAFMRAMGSLGVSLPFFRLLESSVAEAQTPPPLRLLLFFSPHGCTPDYWNPQGGETDFNITFPNAALSPLEKFRSKIFIPIGVDMRVLYEKGVDTGHTCGPCALFTGTRAVKKDTDVYPTGPSLDHVLSQQFGNTTKFRSLELGVYAQAGYSAFDSFNFGDGGTRLPGQDDPAKVYTRVFADLVPPTNTGNDALTRQRAQKQAVIDALKTDIGRISQRLAGPEKQKLDAHLEALKDIERRLGLGVPIGCEKPMAPMTINPADPLQIPMVGQLQMDLVAQAFACDLTRFATLQWMSAGKATHMPWVPGLDVNMHDDVAHRVGDSDAVRLQLADCNRWYATQLAYLMERLDAIKEGTGTVLDHTIILWGNELGNPAAHNNLDQPFVIAGGAGGKFRMGRCVTYSVNKLQDVVDKTKYSAMTAHNAILVSIAQAFGYQQDWFGDEDYKGGLPNLT
jgi:Protein of unknown function (DUF1552)